VQGKCSIKKKILTPKLKQIMESEFAMTDLVEYLNIEEAEKKSLKGTVPSETPKVLPPVVAATALTPLSTAMFPSTSTTMDPTDILISKTQEEEIDMELEKIILEEDPKPLTFQASIDQEFPTDSNKTSEPITHEPELVSSSRMVTTTPQPYLEQSYTTETSEGFVTVTFRTTSKPVKETTSQAYVYIG
jgi:hypothetical protein